MTQEEEKPAKEDNTSESVRSRKWRLYCGFVFLFLALGIICFVTPWFNLKDPSRAYEAFEISAIGTFHLLLGWALVKWYGPGRYASWLARSLVIVGLVSFVIVSVVSGQIVPMLGVLIALAVGYIIWWKKVRGESLEAPEAPPD
ncbi:MAG: hypothetical protein K1Y02_13330 [Candidatus Hydrogenedentes bacterium]|nr:hypothetical protein [Candidatus Hydrogenedentota bacterium]